MDAVIHDAGACSTKSRSPTVPAMITVTVPVVAPDQIVFVRGDFRGDVGSGILERRWVDERRIDVTRMI